MAKEGYGWECAERDEDGREYRGGTPEADERDSRAGNWKRQYSVGQQRDASYNWSVASSHKLVLMIKGAQAAVSR